MTDTHPWYLSFASDDGWLGYAIVEADGFLSAVAVTHALGINPGGEVKGHELNDGIRGEARYQTELNRFISPTAAGDVFKWEETDA